MLVLVLILSWISIVLSIRDGKGKESTMTKTVRWIGIFAGNISASIAATLLMSAKVALVVSADNYSAESW